MSDIQEAEADGRAAVEAKGRLEHHVLIYIILTLSTDRWHAAVCAQEVSKHGHSTRCWMGTDDGMDGQLDTQTQHWALETCDRPSSCPRAKICLNGSP